MTLQDAVPVIQVVALAVNALLVLFIFPLRKAIDDLSRSDKVLTDRIQRLEVKIAEQYVQRGELTVSLDSIMTKLDRIETRLTTRLDTLDSVKADK